MFIDLREGERERERRRERETLMWEKNVDWLLPMCAPAEDQIRSLGVCPDWGSNTRPFGVWINTPTNWATWPGQSFLTVPCFTFIFKNSLLWKMVSAVAILQTGFWCCWKAPQGWSQGTEGIRHERCLRPEGYSPRGQACSGLLRRSPQVRGLWSRPRTQTWALQPGRFWPHS